MSRSFRFLTISSLALVFTTTLFLLHTAPISLAATAQPTAAATTAPTATTDPLTQRKPIVQSFDGVDMVLVPRGCFMMGSDQGNEDEKPVTKVCFDQVFWIDRFEVTQAQFKQFGVANPSKYQGDNRPVDSVSWAAASDFCAKRGARLPTEAEWEYAARGSDDFAYPWGDTYDETKVVFGRSLTDGSAEVGSKPSGASWVGALDMSGNVREWVSSIYKPYPYNSTDGREDQQDGTSPRVLRGGSWYDLPGGVSATVRGKGDPGAPNFDDGFRCARSLGSSPAKTATAAATSASS